MMREYGIVGVVSYLVDCQKQIHIQNLVALNACSINDKGETPREIMKSRNLLRKFKGK